MKMLQIKDISKKFGPITAVKDFSIDIGNGELLAVLGPSGCGKSTLLSCIAGIRKADKGEIFLGKRCLYSAQKGINVPPEERNIGFVFQNYALWPHMTAERNISYPLRIRKRTKPSIKKEVNHILNLLRLEDKGNRYPYQLSGGEQQRVSLGRALIMDPDLLLLDEPLSNLDARLREEMQKEIRRIQRDLKLTVIHVTHDQSEALAMSDRIVVMNNGKFIQEGSPDDVYNNPNSIFAADFVGTSNIIRGKVVKSINKLILVCGNHFRVDVSHLPIKPGERAVFSVRPEDIDITLKKKETADPVGTGEIVEHIYRGAHIQYEVKIGNNSLKVQVHPADSFETGDVVFLYFKRIKRLKQTDCINL